jgi:hypothetical protein
MSSLATGWSWLTMAWAMLPGLMNLKRMSASGEVESRIELVVRRQLGGAAIRPAVEASPTTCCCRSSQGSQNSPLTISSTGSGECPSRSGP